MKNFWNNKKVLVTGHEGFLGSNMAVSLSGNGAKVYGIDLVKGRPISILNGYRSKISGYKADVADYPKIKNIFNKVHPEYVFHLAAMAIVGQAKKDPTRVFKSNVEGTWNVLEAARNTPSVKAVIAASSDKAYGSCKKLPYNEDTPLNGRHPYDASKSCADMITRAYSFSYGLNAAVIRCGNIYGPGDFNFSRLVPDAIRCLIKDKTLVIRSDGSFTRDYVFVDDVVSGYLNLAEKMALKSNIKGEAFNLSNEDPYSVLTVLKRIEKTTGKRIKKKILNQAKDEIHDQYLSSRKIKKTLDWKPTCDFENGIRKTIAWYREIL